MFLLRGESFPVSAYHSTHAIYCSRSTAAPSFHSVFFQNNNTGCVTNSHSFYEHRRVIICITNVCSKLTILRLWWSSWSKQPCTSNWSCGAGSTSRKQKQWVGILSDEQKKYLYSSWTQLMILKPIESFHLDCFSSIAYITFRCSTS